MKTIKLVFLTAGLAVGMVGAAYAADPTNKTVEAVNLESKTLSGKQVRIKGKVVKVNNGIMKRNFLHIQDGSGNQGTNNITITSKQTAKVGDSVTVVGTVVVNKDFGFGYSYPVLVEDSNIQIQ
ncbi:MAG: hypothetical protein OEZ68_09605 [Gammaproteobacteria bacterium]|nr:hypothetical protein [Gammaproteobacteria bacterium]MDH5801042.1 hypothetical protein [Gammaproteobacteria bacterium]